MSFIYGSIHFNVLNNKITQFSLTQLLHFILLLQLILLNTVVYFHLIKN